MTDAEAYRYLERAGEQCSALLNGLQCQLAMNAIKAAVAAEKEACACDRVAGIVAEREACAAAAESLCLPECGHAASQFIRGETCRDIAAAIRSRE